MKHLLSVQTNYLLFHSWGEIYQMINPNENPTLEEEVRSLLQKRRTLFGKKIGK